MTTIRALRDERGYHQRDVADRIGVTAQTVSNWERDAYAPDAYQLQSLARLFGVHAEDITLPPPKRRTRGRRMAAPIASKECEG